MLKLRPDIDRIIGRYGLGQNALAKLAGISQSTWYKLRNPGNDPHRHGGMRATTAWSIVHAFHAHAQTVGQQLTLDDVWKLLIIEVDDSAEEAESPAQ